MPCSAVVEVQTLKIQSVSVFLGHGRPGPGPEYANEQNCLQRRPPRANLACVTCNATCERHSGVKNALHVFLEATNTRKAFVDPRCSPRGGIQQRRQAHHHCLGKFPAFGCFIDVYTLLRLPSTSLLYILSCLSCCRDIVLPFSENSGLVGNDKLERFSESPSKRLSTIGLQKPGVDVVASYVGKRSSAQSSGMRSIDKEVPVQPDVRCLALRVLGHGPWSSLTSFLNPKKFSLSPLSRAPPTMQRWMK